VSIMLRVFTWPWPKAVSGKKIYSVSVRYIRSLYPEQGLSDGVRSFCKVYTYTS
jgi:hypothetical protein